MKNLSLKKMPENWDQVTLEQFRILNRLQGNYASDKAYLTHCFMELQGLKPLLYDSAWKEICSHIPVIKNFIRMNGRIIVEVFDDYLGMGKPFPIWKQCYRYKGVKELLFGKRFWMRDHTVLELLKSLDFMKQPIKLNKNPIPVKIIDGVNYTSCYTRLADMTWLDYNRCCMFIEEYARTKNEQMLWNFISSLYHIGNPDKAKEHFDDLECKLIILFWEGCQVYFRKCFPHLYKGEPKNKTKKAAKDYMKEESELTVFLSRQAYAKPEEVRKMLVFDALQFLELNAKECEEREKEIAKMKRHR